MSLSEILLSLFQPLCKIAFEKVKASFVLSFLVIITRLLVSCTSDLLSSFLPPLWFPRLLASTFTTWFFFCCPVFLFHFISWKCFAFHLNLSQYSNSATCVFGFLLNFLPICVTIFFQFITHCLALPYWGG